jgi:prolyl oligopeptidase
MTALLQSVATDDRPVLLQYFTKAGHSGGQPMSEIIDYTTDEFSFLFWQLGLTFSPSPASNVKN